MTQEQRDNLQKLADFIRAIPQERFDMEAFRSKHEDNFTHECNTIGCVLGYSPQVLYDDFKDVPKLFDSSIDYEGISIEKLGIDPLESEWNWMFGPDWNEVDNSPTGAADRIEWFLKHGVPENWEEQMKGKAPLCYITHQL